MNNQRLPFLLLGFFFLLPLFLRGQSYSNLRIGSRTADNPVLKIDSLSILPESFLLSGMDTSQYTIDYLTATIYLKDSTVLGTRFSYRYRVFHLDYSQVYHNKSLSIITPSKKGYPSHIHVIAPIPEFTADDMALVSSGSISRGFTMGNNQDFVLNSNLNLQLSGILAEGLEITANITDKNIPIQPEGNTQMIQDFDQIFIRLNYQNRFLLKAGDVDITSPHSYFMVVNKRLLGMDFSSRQILKNEGILTNQAGGGISKGKFARQHIRVVNGIQGPYKLSGGQNELHIIILSGSERVYMDGRLLTRGLENDYIIDYNLGEITFTTKNLITAEKRLIVEFEYRSDYYSHYTLFTFNEFAHEKNDKLRLNVNFIHDEDSKNRSIQPELDRDQKIFLAQLGDRVDEAYYSRADTAHFNPNEILYRKTDTIVDGISYSPIYIHSVDAAEQLYRLGFTLVGENKGNYILERSSANGRVFKWVAPANGIAQGNYEPVMLLATPKRVQLGTVSAAYQFRENTFLQTELAFSNHDQNTFSKLDDEDNLGFAVKVFLSHQNKLKSKKESTLPWSFKNQVSYEFLHRNFYTTESFREVEFSRNYNLAEEYSQKNAEQMLQVQTGFTHPEKGTVFYHFNLFSRSGNVNAIRNMINALITTKGYHFSSANSFLVTNDSDRKTHFLKTEQLLSKSFKKIEIGLKELLEYNVFHKQGTDTLIPGSYAFNDFTVFLKNHKSSSSLFHISYKNRIETILRENILATNAIHHEAQLSFELTKLKNNRIKGNVTYRNSRIKDSTDRYANDHFLIGSLEYSGRFFKNAIILTTRYEAGSGMEQKKSFSFLKVADGQGTHVWIDYNGNGIEELNEFEVALLQDQANYIKIWINTPDYILTYNNQFSQTIQLNPANLWSNKKGFLKFLSRFQNTGTFQSYQKNTMKGIGAFNPFQFNIQDSLLIRSTLNFTNKLSFNPLSSYWGIDYIIRANQNKELLYYGFENNKLRLQEIVVRGNPHKSLTLTAHYTYSTKGNHSEYLISRNYDIQSQTISGNLQYVLKNIFFTTLHYTYKQKYNLAGTEKTFNHHIELDINIRMPKKGSFNSSLEFVMLNYNADPNNSIAYEMLEGLNNGKNILWTIGYQSNITDYLQIELSYNGRASAGNKAIHLGNLQLRAHF